MNSENQDLERTSIIEEGKTIAIISYLLFVGLIIAFVMNNEKKNPFALYHIKQSLGLTLTSLALAIINVIPILGSLISLVGSIILFVMWIQGFLAALGGQMKPVFFLGEKYQEWFKSI